MSMAGVDAFGSVKTTGQSKKPQFDTDLHGDNTVSRVNTVSNTDRLRL